MLTYHPEVALKRSENISTQKNCTLMFILALFIIAANGNLWMKKNMWYIHTMECYSAAKKNELDIKEGSKGCIFNADAVDLIKLIDFGSSKGQGDI